MKELEEFEELKQSLMRKMQYQGEKVPAEVISAVNVAFKRLSDMYENYMGRSSSSISEYAEGNFREVRARLNKLQEGRSEDQLGQLREILNRMGHTLEEIEASEEKEGTDKSELAQEKSREQNSTHERISGIDMGTKQIVQRMIDQLQDALTDVRSMARRTMAHHEFSESRIEQIDNEARRLIISLLNSREETIFQSLSTADKKMINNILEEYDQYVEMAGKTEHQKFAAQYEVSEDQLKQIPTKEEVDKSEQRGNSLPRLDGYFK